MPGSPVAVAQRSHRRWVDRSGIYWSARPAAGTRPRENPQRAAPSCCAARCEVTFSTGRLRVLTWIEQPVEMDHEIAHVGVVHGLLRLGLPGGMGGRVIGKHADDFHLIEILEGRMLKIGQFAADDEVEQLLRDTIWHDLSSYRVARQCQFPTFVEDKS